MLVVDSYSIFPFVFRTQSETTSETLKKLEELFGLVGLPKCLVSDNGPAFRSEELRQYFLNRGFELWNSPVAHPKSNGLVNCFVGNFKMHLKMTEGKGDLDSSFLLQYRQAAVHNGKSPSSLIFTIQTLRGRLHVILIKSSLRNLHRLRQLLMIKLLARLQLLMSPMVLPMVYHQAPVLMTQALRVRIPTIQNQPQQWCPATPMILYRITKTV